MRAQTRRWALLLSILAVVATAAACRRGGGGGGGGGDDDDDDDDDGQTATPTPVLVRLGDAGNPGANIPLVIFAADGSVASEATTDAAGEAALQIPAGGSFAVFSHPDSDVYLVHHFFGVVPGNVVAVERDVVAPTPTGTNWPATTI